MSDDSVDACPECDTTAGIYRRHASKPHGRNADADPMWVCRECGAEFETPNTRETHGHTGTQNGLAARLARADPDEVQGE